MNWPREKGRDASPLAPRVDESWLRDVEGGRRAFCRCDVGDAGVTGHGSWTIWRPTAALPKAPRLLACWLTRLCRSLMTTSWLCRFRGKRRRQASCCKPRATTTDAILSLLFPLPPPSARRVRALHALAWWLPGRLAQQFFRNFDAPKTLSVARAHGEKAVGRPRRKCCDARQPEVWRVKRCRIQAGTGTGGDARRPWRLAMRVLLDKMPPVTTGTLFNISATEKSRNVVILLLMTTPLTAA